MSAGLGLQQLLHEPEGLTRLVKALGRLRRYLRTVIRNHKQLRPARRISLLRRLLLRQRRITLRVCNRSLTAHLCSHKEGVMGRIVRRAQRQLMKLLIDLRDNALKANGEHFLVLNRKMSDTVIKIVARRENIVLHRHECLRRHHGCSKLTGSLPLPVLIRLVQPPLRVIRDIKRIRLAGGNRFILCLHPGIRVLREHLAAPGRFCITSHDQLHGTNHHRQLLTNRLKRLRTTQNNRIILGLLIALGHDLGAVRLDHRKLRKQIIDHFLDTGRFCDLPVKILFRHNNFLHIKNLRFCIY